MTKKVTEASIDEIVSAALGGIAKYADTMRGARVVNGVKLVDNEIHVKLVDKTTIRLILDVGGDSPIMP